MNRQILFADLGMDTMPTGVEGESHIVMQALQLGIVSLKIAMLAKICKRTG